MERGRGTSAKTADASHHQLARDAPLAPLPRASVPASARRAEPPAPSRKAVVSPPARQRDERPSDRGERRTEPAADNADKKRRAAAAASKAVEAPAGRREVDGARGSDSGGGGAAGPLRRSDAVLRCAQVPDLPLDTQGLIAELSQGNAGLALCDSNGDGGGEWPSHHVRGPTARSEAAHPRTGAAARDGPLHKGTVVKPAAHKRKRVEGDAKGAGPAAGAARKAPRSNMGVSVERSYSSSGDSDADDEMAEVAKVALR